MLELCKRALPNAKNFLEKNPQTRDIRETRKNKMRTVYEAGGGGEYKEKMKAWALIAVSPTPNQKTALLP